MISRDDLGRKVREAWIAWAQEQPNPKPSWLIPYDDLPELDKEADRRIGEAISKIYQDHIQSLEAELDLLIKGTLEDEAGHWRKF